MKCIDISFDFEVVKLKPHEIDIVTKSGFGSVFEPFLNQAISAKYPQGLGGAKGRTLNRIQQSLDAVKPGEKYLKVEEAEFDLIKEVFLDENTKFQPAQFRLVTIFLNNIERAATSKCCDSNGACTAIEKTECITEAAS